MDIETASNSIAIDSSGLYSYGELLAPPGARDNHGEFDPGSERTLAARLKHASRTERKGLAPSLEWRTGE